MASSMLRVAPPRASSVATCQILELDVAEHAFVVEASRRGDRACGQGLQRLGAQLQLKAAGGEDAVSARDPARGADAAAGSDFEVAGVDVRRVVRQLGAAQRKANLCARFTVASMKRGGKPRRRARTLAYAIVASRAFGMDSGRRM